MKNVLRRRPSGSMIVAVIALVFALAGSAVAAGTISIGDFTKKAKDKTVGVGKLTYVTTNTTVGNPDPTGGTAVTANCPGGLKVIGGGIKGQDPDSDFIFDSYPTTTGWRGRVYAGGGATETRTFTTNAICAASRVVTGAPPSS
jgi:hypothetical protein